MSAPGRGGGLDLLHARVAFRDRSLADVLDLTLRFVVVHGRAYAMVAFGTIVPLLVASLVAGSVVGWIAAWAVALPLALVGEVPFTVLASRLVFEDHVRTKDVLAAGLRDLARVLVVRALAGVLVAAGLSTFLVPGVWLATIFLFLGEVILLERASVGQAFGRSMRVAASAVSDVLIGLVVLGLVPVASVFLADIAGRAVLGELLQFRAPRPLWNTGGGVLPVIGLFVQVPYLATARFFLYLNVRTRAEGWDIQTRFAALAARAEEATEAA